jgi:Ni/Co efflux regulator RcnB
MNSKATLCTLISLALAAPLAAPLASAQERGHRNDHEDQSRSQRNQPGQTAHQQPPVARPAHRAQPRRTYQHQAVQTQVQERGAGPQHAYHRGGRLPSHFHEPQYVVDDWRGHNLSAPPRGYHWVQTGDDYVLVAIATGIILKLILSH